MALVGTPVGQLVDLIIKVVYRAGEATPSPSRILAPTSRKQQASTGVELSLKKDLITPLPL